jgi:hypothetical protein
MIASNPNAYSDADFTTAAPPSLTRQWQAWINGRVKRAEARMLRLTMETVGEVLAEQRNELRALRARVEALEREPAKRLRAVGE